MDRNDIRREKIRGIVKRTLSSVQKHQLSTCQHSSYHAVDILNPQHTEPQQRANPKSTPSPRQPN
jgi:hypothetical protein